MENNGDTVVLAFREDSLFYFNVEDFSDIPPQDTRNLILYLSRTLIRDMPPTALPLTARILSTYP